MIERAKERNCMILQILLPTGDKKKRQRKEKEGWGKRKIQQASREHARHKSGVVKAKGGDQLPEWKCGRGARNAHTKHKLRNFFLFFFFISSLSSPPPQLKPTASVYQPLLLSCSLILFTLVPVVLRGCVFLTIPVAFS